MLERANIIQTHLDQENQKLHQRQALFKRQAGAGAVEADEEFTRMYDQSAFRIEVLRARLARVSLCSSPCIMSAHSALVQHEEIAMRKYVELDRKLSADPRLTKVL